MQRFGCIGPDCEDNCCHSWRVNVDEKTHDLIKLALRTRPEVKERMGGVFNKTPPTKKGRRKRKYKPGKENAYFIDMLPNGNCPMLEHGTFGEKLLPNVCATYPRRMNRIGSRLEVTGNISCPEVARQLLLHDDAIEMVAFDRESIPRMMVMDSRDPRDVRPYWRLQRSVREFMFALLTNTEHPIEKRLLFMTFFAHRTQAVMNKKVMKGDMAAVEREMNLMQREALLLEMSKRFDALETPSALILLLARGLVGAGGKQGTRASFSELVRAIFDSYAELDELLPVDAGPKGRRSDELTGRVFEEYRRRKDAVMSRAGGRVDVYLRNFAFHYWFHRMHFESPDLMVHQLRLLTELATVKFLFFSHPTVYELVKRGADPVSDELFVEQLDEAIVDTFYKIGRYMEHSTLLKTLEQALDLRGLRSVAGAVYLVRF